ncbi:MAG: uroporphyrinogen-III C-methyltransferase [Gammaproteobacteria bacterium]|nr:uroporphyrinogen-III C-methyltransferase [Gammaproteobacteria bacterium]
MTDEPKTPPPTRPRRSPAGGLALLLSLITLIGLGYLWYLLGYQDRILGIPVAQRLTAIERAHTGVERKLTALGVRQTIADERLQRLRRDVRQLSTAGQHAQRFGVREAEDLLLMAGDRLHFDHNVPLALDALREADHDLARERDPRLLAVRQAIADEIVEVRALSHAHTASAALRLVALAHAVDKLPLSVPAHFAPPAAGKPASVPQNFWARAWDGLRRDMLRLIRIRKEPAPERILLAPKRQYFLRQNLKLRLYAAELALLDHDPAAARANLDATQRWVRRYFATGHASVAAFLGEVASLRTRTAAVKWPPLDRALVLLRQIKDHP